MAITGTTISVTGTLTRIKRDADHKPTFEIELENIAYLSRQSVTSNNPSNRMFPFPL